MSFEIVGEITGVETIAVGGGIRELNRLRKAYGLARWRKRKGYALVRFPGEAVRKAEVHWYEATASASESSRSSVIWSRAMAHVNGSSKTFAVCIRNEGYPASLEVRKIYEVLSDPDAASNHLLRIVDESGEDYLYPESLFAPIELPESLREALRLAG